MLSLMQLDIGGAETHVVELAKELKRMGFNPIVTSNGGVYVKELEAAGIKHYRVPLQNKNPINMLKSVRLLKRIIVDEKIDIVHSHARIPSFILGKLHKKMKFPFVTTAHWVFNTKYGLKYITDWGEKTVAVSEDIKTYLMDNYKTPEGNIAVTINGIDTEKFSPHTDTAGIKKEFGINDSDTVIVYVSRMDESRSLAAKQLIEITPELDGFIDNLKVVVVGGGDDFENVSSAAKSVNNKLGRECVVMTGARTDINKFAALADLFVGVSRAALEAMAAEKPVIIAGNEGYIGLFDQSRLDIGIDTNFCCRGCEASSPQLLLRDIKKYFGMSAEQKKEIERFGRELIKREYSVTRMAQDTVKVYKWALEKHDEILISGYYGFKNSGDDALLMAIINDLKANKESPEIVVLSANPKETINRYRVKAINRLNPFVLIKHMKKAGLLISGGGTLIQNSTSTRSMLYYTAVISMAVRNKVKVMLYSNGIGPLNGRKNIDLARRVLDKTDIITLRDPDAMQTLKEIGVTKPLISVTADPVFGMDIADSDYGHELLSRFNVPQGAKKLLGVSVRRTRETNSAFERETAKLCDYAAEKYGYHIVFLPMQFNRDEAISRSIMSKMKTPASIVDIRLDVEEMISVVSNMDLCIGMRLHSLIYAAINRVPLIGIAYDPKIKSFMDYSGQKMCLDVQNIDSAEGMRLIDECESNREKIKQELDKSYLKLCGKAKENGRLAINLYEKGSAEP
jgi:polysaccharide pyruvyl transferase CsaB